MFPKTGAFWAPDFCPKASEFTLETVNPESKTSYPKTGAFREPDFGAPARHGEAGHARGPHSNPEIQNPKGAPEELPETMNPNPEAMNLKPET